MRLLLLVAALAAGAAHATLDLGPELTEGEARELRAANAAMVCEGKHPRNEAERSSCEAVQLEYTGKWSGYTEVLFDLGFAFLEPVTTFLHDCHEASTTREGSDEWTDFETTYACTVEKFEAYIEKEKADKAEARDLVDRCWLEAQGDDGTDHAAWWSCIEKQLPFWEDESIDVRAAESHGSPGE